MGISAFAGRTKKIRGIRRSILIFLLMAIGIMYLMFLPQTSEVYAFGGEPTAGEVSGNSYEGDIPETPDDADIPEPEEDQTEVPGETDPVDSNPEEEQIPEGDSPEVDTPESGTPTEDDTPSDGEIPEGDITVEAAAADDESIEEPPQEEAFIDPSGTVYDAITRAAINTASVNLLKKDTLTDTYVAYGNEGDGLPYTCTDGTYNFNLATGYDYQITASATDYNAYSWDFSQVDGTEHKINFFLIPLLTGGTAGGWASFNNDVTIDQNIYSAGNDIENPCPGGL